MIRIEKAVDAIAEFASRDVVSTMPNGLGKFAANMAIVSARNNPEQVLKPYDAFLKMTGILSEDGKSVDEQSLYNALMGAFKEMPSVTFLGFTFNQQDAEKLLQRMLQ